MNEKNLIEILYTNRKMKTNEECIAFEQAFSELTAKLQNSDDLHQLLLVFDDECELIDIVWGLVHYVETFETSIYIPTLVRITQVQLEAARSWLRILYVRLLNHSDSRAFLKSFLASLDEVEWSATHKIVEAIAQDDTANDQLRERAKFILENISSAP